MKKIFRFMMAALAATAAMTSCQQENLEPDVQEQETVEVKVTIGEQTKGFTDLEGITWEVGDQIKYAGGVELTSEPLTAEKISADGYTASFTFAASLNAVDRTGWFVSTKCCPRNNDEVDFTKVAAADNKYSITQEEAGVMNNDYLFLHSGTGLVSIAKDEAPEITMDIAGSIFRLIPYTNKYNTESVVSVKMVSNTPFLGTVVYDRGGSKYTDAATKNYFAAASLAVKLGSELSLEEVTSAETSKGIYMAIAATSDEKPLDGYQYIVETDMALYTFDAMDEELVVGENVVKNIMLNLDKAVREGFDDHKGYVWYEGNPNNSNVTAEAGYLNSCGYTVARYSDVNGENWVTATETKGVHEFLYSATYTYTDENGNEISAEDSWLNVGFSEANICHWSLTYEANPNPTPRTIYVKGVMNNPRGYTNVVSSTDLTPKTYEYNFSVTQAGAGALKNVTFAGDLAGEKTFDGVAIDNAGLGYWLAYVDGIEYRDWNGALYPNVKFNCISVDDFNKGNFTTEDNVGWLTACFQNDGTKITDCIVRASLTENTTGAERTAYIILLWPEVEGYTYPQGNMRTVKITQKANIQVSAVLNKTYAGTVPASGDDITLGTLALTVNGEAAADVAAAMTQYGVTVTANNGATVEVAADGTVTMDVPANPYANGGKEYTVTVKHNGNTLATATVNQAEGEDEAQESLYEFTPSLSHAWGASWGFGNAFAHTTTGHYLTVSGVKVDGNVAAFTNSPEDKELGLKLLNIAFKSHEPSVDEIASLGHAGYTPVIVSFAVIECVGDTVRGAYVMGDGHSITKITGYSPNGTEIGSVFFWID